MDHFANYTQHGFPIILNYIALFDYQRRNVCNQREHSTLTIAHEFFCRYVHWGKNNLIKETEERAIKSVIHITLSSVPINTNWGEMKSFWTSFKCVYTYYVIEIFLIKCWYLCLASTFNLNKYTIYRITYRILRIILRLNK